MLISFSRELPRPSRSVVSNLSDTRAKSREKQGRQCAYKPNTLARSRNHCYRGKAMSITYSESVSVALIIQHSKRMCRIILS
jgi:hypothetical protein